MRVNRCSIVCALTALLLCSCTTTEVGELTQVSVFIDAEPTVAGQADTLRVTVRSASAGSDHFGDASEQTLAEGAIAWPVSLALVPREGDASRRFEITATALSGGEVVAQATAISGYVAGRVLVLQLLLQDACIDVDCAEGQTCNAGSCESAVMPPQSLPEFDPEDPAFSDPTPQDGSTPQPVTDSAALDDDASTQDDPLQDDAGSGTSFTVGGVVGGLTGMIVLRNNNGDDLSVNENGSFVFATPVMDGGAYNVTVATQPAGQVCTASSNAGVIAGANVDDVIVTCASDSHPVGGTVSGLAGTGLTLRNNGGDDLAIVANGDFTFATEVAQGGGYEVTVASAPNGPRQTCTVTAGSGTVGGSAVTDVAVTCVTDSFTVGGAVGGLAGSGLVLRNNGADDLAVNADGAFSFPVGVQDGTDYAVTVQTQPTGLSQTCSVTNGSGTVEGANVTSVGVACVTNSFTVGGEIDGLEGSGLELSNGSDSLFPTQEGNFEFPEQTDGTAYDVQVEANPVSPSQTCSVTSAAGTVAGADVEDVEVSCITDTFRIGGNVTGLTRGEAEITLTAPGVNEPLEIEENGDFMFGSEVPDLGTYTVEVTEQPETLNCTVTNGTGTVSNDAVENISVDCVPATGTFTVTVEGLPSGLDADITVLGPDNVERTVTETTVFQDAVVGDWAVTASSIAEAPGSWDPTPNGDNVQVTRDGSSASTVRYSYTCATVVNFTDATLETRVRSALGVGNGHAITCGDMASLRTLDVGNSCCDRLPPNNLVGLEWAIGLEELVVRYSEVSDLSPLANLPRLRSLSVTKSNIADLTPLSTVTTLEVLNAGNNFITDLSPIAGNTALTVLDLNNNSSLESDDLEDLEQLVSLQTLQIFNIGGIVTLEPLSPLVSLEILGANYTRITNLDGLQDMPNLRIVAASNSFVNDLSHIVDNEDFNSGSLSVGNSCLNLMPGSPDAMDVDTLVSRGVNVQAANNPRPVGCD